MLSGLTGGALADVTPSGSFLVHLNENESFSDSKKTVEYYDANHLDQGPLFSVYVPWGVESGNLAYEDTEAIDVDPGTGDVYVLSPDYLRPGQNVGDVENVSPFGDIDTVGDFDIYRINFNTVYDYWLNNHFNQDVRSLSGAAAIDPTSPSPNLTTNDQSPNPNHKLDYVTYYVHNSLNALDVDSALSNTHLLPAAIEKIGEVAMNYSVDPLDSSEHTPYLDYTFEFVDSNTLMVVDNHTGDYVSGGDPNPDPAHDREYRIFSKVSDAPGLAPAPAAPGGDGGYNVGTTESWRSDRIGLVNLDFDSVSGLPVGHSELETSAYYLDPASGVQGVWVAESDGAGGGDDIAFYEFDSSGNPIGYRAIGSAGISSIAADNDPLANGNDNAGKVDHILVDPTNGDLIIVESGYGDATDGIDTVDREPGVYRIPIDSYDEGGLITLGTPTAKMILDPLKEDDDTAGGYLERGFWTAYDSENNDVVFVSPSGSSSVGPYQDDIHVLDLDTGLTTTYQNVDDSVSLFLGDSFGDKVDYFTLSTGGLAGDYNGDGSVDAADYTVWRDMFGQTGPGLAADGNGDNAITEADYDVWKAHFGETSSSGSVLSGAGATVPEPSALLMAAIGLGLVLGIPSRKRCHA